MMLLQILLLGLHAASLSLRAEGSPAEHNKTGLVEVTFKNSVNREDKAVLRDPSCCVAQSRRKEDEDCPVRVTHAMVPGETSAALYLHLNAVNEKCRAAEQLARTVAGRLDSLEQLLRNTVGRTGAIVTNPPKEASQSAIEDSVWRSIVEARLSALEKREHVRSRLHSTNTIESNFMTTTSHSGKLESTIEQAAGNNHRLREMDERVAQLEQQVRSLMQHRESMDRNPAHTTNVAAAYKTSPPNTGPTNAGPSEDHRMGGMAKANSDHELEERVKSTEDKVRGVEDSLQSTRRKSALLEEDITTLETRTSGIERSQDSIEKRLVELEKQKETRAPRTCHDVKRLLGEAPSGEYQIDPDGHRIGSDPVTVYCDMDADEAVTIVSHNLTDSKVKVEHCEGPGCHVTPVKYKMSNRHLSALIKLSGSCSQTISYDCQMAPLVKDGKNMGWWTGGTSFKIKKQPNVYWDGAHAPSHHTCACGASNGSCVGTASHGHLCNCDSNIPSWLADEGTLTNKSSLPVTQLNFGGLFSQRQAASFTLGPLRCSGRKHFVPSESCENLRLAGQQASGYYFVDGPNGALPTYDMVYCNMEIDSGGADLQTPTLTKLPKRPIAFDARFPVAPKSARQPVAFSSTMVNEGNAMHPETGHFAAPLDGIYFFSFCFQDGRESEGPVSIQVYVNNDRQVAYINAPEEEEGTRCFSFVVKLHKGDTLWLRWLYGSVFWGSMSTHFSGHLIFPI